MLSNHVIICYPLLLLPSIFPSIRIFSNESALCTRWPKYWSFSFSISPFNEYSGLISFSIDWFDLLEVQGTLTSLLQHHSSKASIHKCSAFFMVQLSHPYTTTGKTKALTIDRIQRILSTELEQATSVPESTRSVVLRSLCTWILWGMARGLSAWRGMSGRGIIFEDSEDILGFHNVLNEKQ